MAAHGTKTVFQRKELDEYVESEIKNMFNCSVKDLCSAENGYKKVEDEAKKKAKKTQEEAKKAQEEAKKAKEEANKEKDAATLLECLKTTFTMIYIPKELSSNDDEGIIKNGTIDCKCEQLFDGIESNIEKCRKLIRWVKKEAFAELKKDHLVEEDQIESLQVIQKFHPKEDPFWKNRKPAYETNIAQDIANKTDRAGTVTKDIWWCAVNWVYNIFYGDKYGNHRHDLVCFRKTAKNKSELIKAWIKTINDVDAKMNESPVFAEEVFNNAYLITYKYGKDEKKQDVEGKIPGDQKKAGRGKKKK